MAGDLISMTKFVTLFFYRFGSQVEAGKMSGSKAKCIVARIRIYLSDGTEFTERPAHDKYGLRGSVNI